MRLFDFILENMESILKEWESFAREIQPSEIDMDVNELSIHAEDMLRVIASDMQTPQTLWERSNKSRGKKPKASDDTAAETHAVSRLASGFSINLLAAEYRALRASVLDLWLWDHKSWQPEDYSDLIRFNEAVDQALAESLQRYSEIVLMEQNVFLGILGHDLRTPLQSISNGAEYLMLTNDDSQTARTGRLIQNSVKRMAGMVNNLLDFTQSRISGGIQIVPAETDLAEVAKQIVGELSANNPGRAIRNEIKGNCKGQWDAGRIAQVYQNLIGNALQYGDTDRAVTVTSEGDSDEVTIRIHNDGAHIPEREQEQLFDLLHRHALAEGEKNPDRNLGLGLYIVREIVLAHGGTITVTSTEVDGTDFVVRLPRRHDAARTSAKSHVSRVARATGFTLQ